MHVAAFQYPLLAVAGSLEAGVHGLGAGCSLMVLDQQNLWCLQVRQKPEELSLVGNWKRKEVL